MRQRRVLEASVHCALIVRALLRAGERLTECACRLGAGWAETARTLMADGGDGGGEMLALAGAEALNAVLLTSVAQGWSAGVAATAAAGLGVGVCSVIGWARERGAGGGWRGGAWVAGLTQMALSMAGGAIATIWTMIEPGRPDEMQKHVRPPRHVHQHGEAQREPGDARRHVQQHGDGGGEAHAQHGLSNVPRHVHQHGATGCGELPRSRHISNSQSNILGAPCLLDSLVSQAKQGTTLGRVFPVGGGQRTPPQEEDSHAPGGTNGGALPQSRRFGTCVLIPFLDRSSLRF